VDADGKPLRQAILYGIDTRAIAEMEELERVFGKEKIFQISLMNLSTQSTGPKILWIKNHEPQIYHQTRYFLTSEAYLVQKLTGSATLDYLTKVEAVTITCMARIIGELMADIKVPFGVNALWDPIASLDLSVAVDAKFVREVFTGVYAGDLGLWNTNCGEVVRHQHRIGAENVKLLFNIVPESARYLADREVVEIAKSTVFNARPDALCVSGLTAGVETDTQTLKSVKDAVPNTLVFANTGVRAENVIEQLSVADGAVVGTTFKVEGKFENHVDETRVKAFMDKVKAFRKN